MSSRLAAAVVALAALGVGAGGAHAQSPATAVFAKLKESAVSDTREIYEAGKRLDKIERRDIERVTIGSERPTPLEPESAAATADRISLAVRTALDKVEAGAAIAPFALLGSEEAPGLRLTMATLKEDKIRLGVGYTWDTWRPLLTPAQLGLKACEFGEKEEKALRQALDSLEPAYERVCTVLVEPIRQPDLEFSSPAEGDVVEALWTSARVSCGLAPLDPAATSLAKRGPDEGLTLAEALASITHAVGAAKKNPVVTSLATTQEKADLAQLDAFALPQSTDCHTAAQLRRAFLETQWNQRRRRIGLSATADFFPLRFGFNPAGDDPAKRLPHGEPDKLQLAVESSWTRRRSEWAVGAAFNESREDYLKAMRGSVAPSLTFAVAAFGLSGRPLEVNGLPQLENGMLPPHVVLGLKMSADIALARRASQTTSFNSVSIQPFADVKVNEKVTVRFAIPVKGEIKKRDKDDTKMPAVLERRSLQWTVPVSIVTVVKL